MPQPYRGKPRSVTRISLPDGRTAALVPRERKHFSGLHNGYPLAEEFLAHLTDERVDAVAIDDGDGEGIYVFDLRQYRTGDRLGHTPYPMKRVANVNDATRLSLEDDEDDATRGDEWEWLTDDDLRLRRDRTDRSDASSSALSGDKGDESSTAD